LIGLTPAQISSRSRPEVLSFLYNTAPFFMRYDTNVPYAQREDTICAR
jgi:hypothetical protein